MNNRSFAGMLNSKSVYGQSWGSSENFRLAKFNRISMLECCSNLLWRGWYKKSKLIYPEWAPWLYNIRGDLTYSQRTENMQRKKKKFEMFRWKQHK